MAASDPLAVVCPACNANPFQPCHENGRDIRFQHAWRIQLATALVNDSGDDVARDAARLFREHFPDVDATRPVCAPSRSQFLWRARWGIAQGKWNERAWADEQCAYPDEWMSPRERELRSSLKALPEGTGPDPLADALQRIREREQQRQRTKE